MRAWGFTEIGTRAQRVVRDDPRFDDVLAVEHEGTLTLYSLAIPNSSESWRRVYTEWARAIPVEGTRDKYRLSHLALNGHWQELDIEGSLEHCVRAIVDNKYHLFFC